MFGQQLRRVSIGIAGSIALAVLSCSPPEQGNNGNVVNDKQIRVTIHRQQSDCRMQVLASYKTTSASADFEALEVSEESFLVDVSKVPINVNSLSLGVVCRDSDDRIAEMGSSIVALPLNTKEVAFSLTRLPCQVENGAKWCSLSSPVSSITQTAVWAGDPRGHAWIVGNAGRILAWNGFQWQSIENTFNCLDLYGISGSAKEDEHLWISATQSSPNCDNTPLFYEYSEKSFLTRMWVPAVPRNQASRLVYSSSGSNRTLLILTNNNALQYSNKFDAMPTDLNFAGYSKFVIDAAFSQDSNLAMPWFLYEQRSTPKAWFVLNGSYYKDLMNMNPMPSDSNFFSVTLSDPSSLSIAPGPPVAMPNMWVAGKKFGPTPPVALLLPDRQQLTASFKDVPTTTPMTGCSQIYASSSSVAYAACDSLVLRCSYDSMTPNVTCSPVLELEKSPRDSLIGIYGSKNASGKVQLWVIGKQGAIWLYEGPE